MQKEGSRTSLPGINKRTVLPRLVMVSAWLRSARPIIIGTCFILISRLLSFMSSRSVVVQLPPDVGLPTWMVGLCLRPVYGLNDAPRRWWNRLDKFLRSVGMEPTRADRCTYVAYEGIGSKKDKSYLAPGSFSQEGT